MKTIPGPDFSYVEALDHLTNEHLQELRDKGEDQSKMPLRPSASGQCERELAYALMEYRGLAKYEKELHDSKTHRVFGLGHSVEYHILKEFKQFLSKVGITVRYQQQSLSFVYLESEVDPKFSSWIEGSIDFVLWSDKFKAIGDVKSKKEKFSSYRESSWEEDNDKLKKCPYVEQIGDSSFYIEDLAAFLHDFNDPFLAANFLQLNLYANNPFIVERGIDHCVLIYYSKNTSRLREIRFKPSKDVYNYVLNKFAAAFSAVEQNNPELADKEYQLGSIKCAFCSYRKECWKADDPLRAYFKTLPPKRWPKDTSRLGETGEVIERMFEGYLEKERSTTELSRIEQEIVEFLIEQKIDKIKLSSNEIFEVKLYKSPSEHFRLKRSKL